MKIQILAAAAAAVCMSFSAAQAQFLVDFQASTGGVGAVQDGWIDGSFTSGSALSTATFTDGVFTLQVSEVGDTLTATFLDARNRPAATGSNSAQDLVLGDGIDDGAIPASSPQQVTGTGIDDVLQDFYSARNGDLVLAYGGATIGQEYLLTLWHNDPEQANWGFNSPSTGNGADDDDVSSSPSSVAVTFGAGTGTTQVLQLGAGSNLPLRTAQAALTPTILSFTATATDFSVSVSSADNGQLAVNGASLVAVPEPSSFAALGLLGAGAVLRRRR